MTPGPRSAIQRVRNILQPRNVDIPVPAYFEDNSVIRLSTVSGRDYIAVQLSRNGWSSFESPLPDVVGSLCRLGHGSFLDVGANTGVYSLIAAKASTRIRIHAFEPYSPATDVLLSNIDLNNAGQRVTVCASALSDHVGTQSLYLPVQDHGLLESSASLNEEFKPEHSEVLEVPVTTLDEYLERAVDADNVGLLKIDVESAEHLVLAGATETIAKHQSIIVAEVLHLADHEWLNDFCRQHDYRIFTLHKGVIVERDRVEFHGDAWNQCFCPRGKIGLLQRAADMIGLSVKV